MNFLSRFPSYEYLLKAAGLAFARFPFTILSSILGVVVGIYLVELEGSLDEEYFSQKLLMVSALGLPLFTALAVFSERQLWSRILALGFQALGVALLALYFLSLPQDVTIPLLHIIRFVLLLVGLHFLVAWIAYVGKNQVTGFWQFNKALFLRFHTAIIYSAVMYFGLTIALGSADFLFDVEVKGERYFELWIIIYGIFQTWIFLAGLPEDLDSLNTPQKYPVGLKVFAQFILLPLVVLYFAILFAYEAKITLSWNWPKGWVSQLVLWYSVIGLLSLLLLHPLRTLAENKWINVFTKWFFRAFVPLLVMLFLAIARRISDYGVTENRYFVVAMALGLAVVVAYFIISKAKDIRLIPIVITGIAFFSAFGPWSAFSVSKKSQQGRLGALLIANVVIADDLGNKDTTEFSFDDRSEMSNIVRYLNKVHGPESFSQWIS
ncbi:MAG: DUF4153 domain-containing protein, partial [candidate division Zixibacteria bacterium]|nr:DUF4153 domain-containing protein [candidate division Zixibacteria bacterium]